MAPWEVILLPIQKKVMLLRYSGNESHLEGEKSHGQQPSKRQAFLKLCKSGPPQVVHRGSVQGSDSCPFTYNTCDSNTASIELQVYSTSVRLDLKVNLGSVNHKLRNLEGVIHIQSLCKYQRIVPSSGQTMKKIMNCTSDQLVLNYSRGIHLFGSVHRSQSRIHGFNKLSGTLRHQALTNPEVVRKAAYINHREAMQWGT